MGTKFNELMEKCKVNGVNFDEISALFVDECVKLLEILDTYNTNKDYIQGFNSAKSSSIRIIKNHFGVDN